MRGKITIALMALTLMSCSKETPLSERNLDYTYGRDLSHDMIVLGEGGGACYSYMHLERFENGAKRIAVTGLDLSADRPESNAILKGAIEFLYDVP